MLVPAKSAEANSDENGAILRKQGGNLPSPQVARTDNMGCTDLTSSQYQTQVITHEASSIQHPVSQAEGDDDHLGDGCTVS
jgi:hypothetical protein